VCPTRTPTARNCRQDAVRHTRNAIHRALWRVDVPISRLLTRRRTRKCCLRMIVCAGTCLRACSRLFAWYSCTCRGVSAGMRTRYTYTHIHTHARTHTHTLTSSSWPIWQWDVLPCFAPPRSASQCFATHFDQEHTALDPPAYAHTRARTHMTSGPRSNLTSATSTSAAMHSHSIIHALVFGCIHPPHPPAP